MSVQTIPSGQPFLRTLARGVLQQSARDGISLPDTLILLPNRRAGQSLRETFLDLSDGKPMLLPRIQAIGDVEEEELSFALTGSLAAELTDLPPALSPLERTLLLTRLIRQAHDGERSLDQALLLAQALGRLLDQVVIEGISFDALPQLVPEDYAQHWQVTLSFLEILSRTWPKILEERGVIDAAGRRNRLLRLLTQHWIDHPPAYPVIAAGTTGTIPATADLLRAVMTLPQGQIILPGLDHKLDEESWAQLDPSHPQYTLKELLQHLSIERAHVSTYVIEQEKVSQDDVLLSEVMRPAATTDLWRDIDPAQAGIEHRTEKLSVYECPTVETEAMVAALALRQALETPQQTAALVTPDRQLAARVQRICRRWGIALDDSAGQALADTPAGVFIRLVLETLIHPAPVSVLALAKHPFFRPQVPLGEKEPDIQQLDLTLRGPAPANISALLSQDSASTELIRSTLDIFHKRMEAAPLSMRDMIEAHLNALETLSDVETLWTGEAGEAAALFFARLLDHADHIGTMKQNDYGELIDILLREPVVRPRYGTHPRLAILGQIEARLLQYDVMILGGLNEGVWPPTPSPDPWMSRPMRTEFGLPDPERGIGQAAHDFVQSFAAERVILTRSLRRDGGPTVPARWLSRLDTCLSACGFDPDILRRGPLLSWATQLDRPVADEVSPAPRPAPRPPVAARPTSLPVTAIELWQRDPYALYAKYILRLRPLDPLEQDADAALRGSWLHDLCEWFVRSYPQELPQHAADILLQHALEHPNIPKDLELWRPHLERLIQWFVRQEDAWRKVAQPELLEERGEMALGEFTLFGTADRIDRLREGGMAIIDYKTGSLPAKKDVKESLAPQLPLEAAILQQGGFGVKLEADTPVRLIYWKLSGGRPPGEVVDLAEGRSALNIDQTITDALEGVRTLFKAYRDQSIAYIALPDSTIAPAWQDYAHLARTAEWQNHDTQEAS